MPMEDEKKKDRTKEAKEDEGRGTEERGEDADEKIGGPAT